MLKRILFSVAVLSVASSFATEPSGYYSSCENKSGAALLSALCDKVGPHTTVSYSGLWTLYKTTDVKANGKIWDMYSTKEWTYSKEQCGSYSNVGDCYNREHSFPKSWFNDASPMVSDAFHIYPTDGKVNGQRSNYPYGECANGTTLSSSSSVKALGKLGKSTFDGYSGTVFEPDDEYKGDFARSYFYMAAAYNNKISSWSSDMLAKNSYPAFSSWAIDLLLKWHRQDPVSQKEIDRNEAVYAAQDNRNPFIDHPEMAEYIWGDKTSELWTSSASADPTIVLPSNKSTLALGSVGVGVAHSVDVVIKGSNLTQDVKISVSDGIFSVSASTVSAAAANASDGTKIALTVTAATAGDVTGVLYVASGDAKSVVYLTATAYDGLPASSPTDITTDSFYAHWTYVGNEDSHGAYTLHVLDENGDEVDTYPRSVPAQDEKALVDELEPETTYTYYITNGVLTSNRITVTTGALMPSIQLLHDGDLELFASSSEPSDAEEIIIDAENIYDNITISVNAPFQLSTDKSNWAQSITVDPQEDRFYIRLNCGEEGLYESEIFVNAGDFSSDQAVVYGRISDSAAFIEDFENEASTNGYNGGSVTGSAAKWITSNAGVYSNAGEAYEGSNSVRFGTNTNSYIAMDQDKANGAGTVSFYAATFGTDTSASFNLLYSTDGGESWTEAGRVGSTTKAYQQYTFTINQTGNIRLKFQQTTGKRMNIDYITITDYRESAGLDGVKSDYKSWDAFSRNGDLILELAQPQNVKVYGIDGVTYYNALTPAGQTSLTLAPGLYIVLVDDFTRRVLLK